MVCQHSFTHNLPYTYIYVHVQITYRYKYTHPVSITQVQNKTQHGIHNMASQEHGRVMRETVMLVSHACTYTMYTIRVVWAEHCSQ